MNKEDIVILFIILIFIGFFYIYLMAVHIWKDIDKEIEEDKQRRVHMAKRVAKFEKVSKQQFIQDWQHEFMGSEEWAGFVYDRIKLPVRATKYSAGYDFFAPMDFTLKPGETVKIPTGIRCGINTDWVLMIYPRSGLGFKYREMLANTVGVVDSDYFYSDNEGHIFIKVVNAGDKTLHIESGNGFAQGIFTEYGITEDDHVETERNGGFGSTDKKEFK